MRSWILRIHIWLGLLSCTALITFGAAGLSTAWRQRPWRPAPESIARDFPFAASVGASNREIADRVHEMLAIPLSGPIPDRALRRDNGKLTFTYYTLNADHTVTVFPQGGMRVQTRPVHTADFLNRLHSTKLRLGKEGLDWRVRLWSFYIEFSVWALLLMPVTGVLLWTMSRPRYKAAWLAAGVAVLSAIIFYALVR